MGTLLDLTGTSDLTPAAVPRFAPSFAVEDVDRFWSYVLRGPERDDCWFWTGAIADDGYGRFWTADPTPLQRPARSPPPPLRLRAGDRDRSLPTSCSATAATSRCACESPPSTSAWATSAPTCSSAPAAAATPRLHDLAVAWNLRAQRVARSRELRQVLRTHGWDRDRIHAVLTGQDSNTPTLW